MHVIESLDDLRALVASDDVKIVCVGAKTSLETPEFARAVFGTNERAITTFHKMVASITAESTRSTVLTFGDADEGATLVELVVCALPEKASRHNSPISSHSIASMAKAAIGGSRETRGVRGDGAAGGDVRGERGERDGEDFTAV